MVKRKIVVLMCMALMLAALPAFDGAYAQQGQGKGKRGAPADDGLYPGCPLNLNLTQEQSTKLQDVRNAFFKDTAGLRSDIFKKEQDMDVLMLEKTIDVEKAKKLQDEISGLRSPDCTEASAGAAGCPQSAHARANCTAASGLQYGYRAWRQGLRNRARWRFRIWWRQRRRRQTKVRKSRKFGQDTQYDSFFLALHSLRWSHCAHMQILKTVQSVSRDTLNKNMFTPFGKGGDSNAEERWYRSPDWGKRASRWSRPW